MSRALPEPAAPASPMPQRVDAVLPLWAVAQVVLLSAGWGGNAPALRFSLHFLPPFAAAGLRFLIGVAVILLFARLQRVSLRVPRREWAALAGIGLLFAVQICLLNLGSARTEAARQALLINAYPLFVPVIAHYLLPGDRLSLTRAAGTLVAFAGMLLLLGERALGRAGSPQGDLLVMASAVLLAGKAVYTSFLVRTLHPYPVLFWQMAVGIPCFFGMSLGFETQRYSWSLPVALSLLYQGVVVAGLCFVGWTALLRHFSPSRLSVGFFLTPLFGALFSYWLLGEAITGGLFAAGLLIAAGMALVNR